MTEEKLIELCKQQDRLAQKQLYDKYAKTMFATCKRYLKNTEDAEEALIEGFYKVLSKIDRYEGQGSFEGWIRRIMINEALMFLRKNYKFYDHIEIEDNLTQDFTVNIPDKFSESDIMKLLDELPTGCRTIFNLFVLEGYKHREIADILQISINTSKSQLIVAKSRLKVLFEQNYMK